MCTQKNEIEIKKKNGDLITILTKCRKCWECKKENARLWTYRIWNEIMVIDKEKLNFITLTYNNKYNDNKLHKEHLQKFFKKLRKNNPQQKNIKYLACGEYGTRFKRPHYHIILINFKFNDKVLLNTKSKRMNYLYTSEQLNKLWKMGISTIQPFGIKEIPYITLYTNNKNNWDKNFKIKLNQKIKNNKTLTKIKNKKKYERTEQEEIKLKNETKKLKKKLEENKPNEFKLYSKGIGFNNFNNNKEWENELIINEIKHEIPREWLIKADNIANEKENYKDSYFINKILEERQEKILEELHKLKKPYTTIQNKQPFCKNKIDAEQYTKITENFNKQKLKLNPEKEIF